MQVSKISDRFLTHTDGHKEIGRGQKGGKRRQKEKDLGVGLGGVKQALALKQGQGGKQVREGREPLKAKSPGRHLLGSGAKKVTTMPRKLVPKNLLTLQKGSLGCNGYIWTSSSGGSDLIASPLQSGRMMRYHYSPTSACSGELARTCSFPALRALCVVSFWATW